MCTSTFTKGTANTMNVSNLNLLLFWTKHTILALSEGGWGYSDQKQPFFRISLIIFFDNYFTEKLSLICKLDVR